MQFIFYYVGEHKNEKGLSQNNKFKKFLGFFDILQLPQNVISITEKLTHPTVQQRSLRLRNVEYGFILAQDLYCEYVILRKSSSLTVNKATPHIITCFMMYSAPVPLRASAPNPHDNQRSLLRLQGLAPGGHDGQFYEQPNDPGKRPAIPGKEYL